MAAKLATILRPLAARPTAIWGSPLDCVLVRHPQHSGVCTATVAGRIPTQARGSGATQAWNAPGGARNDEGGLSRRQELRQVRADVQIVQYIERLQLGRRKRILNKLGLQQSTRTTDGVFASLPRAKFYAAVAKPEGLADLQLTAPEIAFVGRSNVGKSSLLNAIAAIKRKGARTDAKPGKTQSINFFPMGDALTLVDLPGYYNILVMAS